jgi:hypothetical protein|tara:strand:- start:1484 stop:1690 length:207 start_codon:yes stop_codon:yes gene_type:complete
MTLDDFMAEMGEIVMGNDIETGIPKVSEFINSIEKEQLIGIMIELLNYTAELHGRLNDNEPPDIKLIH